MSRHASLWRRQARRVPGEARWQLSEVSEAVLERDVEPPVPRAVAGETFQSTERRVRNMRVRVETGKPAPLLMRLAIQKMTLERGFFKRDSVMDAREDRPERVALDAAREEARALRAEPTVGNPVRDWRPEPTPRGMRQARPCMPEAPDDGR